ncbi:hypothetical protein BVG16_19920 [Paenibacillus selenitireducens]|uniref:SLH domain-containing protein n=1 Tax=Paenibacillus selenitireducens TaxID=1324314 RepID=A0A1T2X6V9_9BACL|nr:S8 family serine peptidase [Paenibacillus selenitireducens]OPA75610.1 hypothetical protein BVG16_19920 [Paenibacillus selenitireducens]
MNKHLLSRKLSLLMLALGLTLGTLPSIASASNSTYLQLPQDARSLADPSDETIISPQINTTSSNKVRVIVQLTGQPAAVGKYAAKQGIRSLAATATEPAVNAEQSSFLRKVTNQHIDLQVNYQYNTVLNGFEVTIPANEIPELAQIEGVKSIQENHIWYPIPIESSESEETGNYESSPLKQIGAIDAWKNGYTGAGLKVGVIDTGVDYTHPDIAPAYKGGYDSFYRDSDPYEEVPLTPEEDVEYGTGYEGTYHGTHVAGTIIGRFANKTSDIVQKGVAYGADLYAYKVLGRDIDRPDKSSGTSAQVIDGIERAVKDGMDVINLSLGSDSEKDVNSPDAVAINNAVLSGVVAVIANGNAGPGSSSMGSPATSQLAIAVGAVTSETKYFTGHLTPELVHNDGSVTSATYATYGNFNVMAWETAQEDFHSILGDDPHEVVYVGLGGDSDYIGKNAEGKIVLASRGSYAFIDKIAAAKAHGAKAIVIFNGNADPSNPTQADLSEYVNGRDGLYGGNLGDSFDFIPTVDLAGKEGRALARALIQNPETRLQFTFPSSYPDHLIPGDKLADFSSWGPNADANLSIKPDIAAPGVNILSTWPAYGKGKPETSYDKAYNRISGTSMATPHVAGLALLLKQAHPNWSPFDIRAALANTADGIVDDDGDRYDVYQQGAGRANVASALKTPALLQALEPITILDKNFNPQSVMNYNSSTSFGVVAPGTPQQIKNLQLKNTGNNDVTYTTRVDWYSKHDGIEAALDHETLTANAGRTSTLQLKLNVGTAAEEAFYEGQITLESSGLPTLHLPFVVYVGQEQPANGFGIQELYVTNSVVYPNRTTQSSTDLSFKLTADDTNLLEIDVVDLNDATIGYFTSQTTKDLTNERFEPGKYVVQNLNNKYYPYDEEGNPILNEKGEPTSAYLKDGIYKILVYAAQLNSKGQIVKDKNGQKIEYSGVISYRVDNSSSNTGGTGGPSGGGSSVIIPPTNPSTPAVTDAAKAVIEQGLKQIVVASKSTGTNAALTATIADNDLKTAIASASTSPAAIVVPVTSNKDANVTITFTADQIKQFTSLPSQSSLVIQVGGSAISIPASLLAKAPANNDIELAIHPAANQAAAFLSKVAGSTVIGTPVSFEANWVKDTIRTAVPVPSDTFIKRAFTLPGSIEANSAGVLFEENGIITPVASIFQKQKDNTTIVTVSRPGFSVYAAVNRAVKFDDIEASWAASHITALANKLIINGTNETTFSPKTHLTRAAFTSLLVRSLGLRSSKTTTSFTDVKSSDWYANDVAAAFASGLIQGKDSQTFAPNDNVTRQELTVILDRALQLTGVKLKPSTPSLHAYADNDKIAAYAKDSVSALSAAGIIRGDTSDDGSLFHPQAATTRETAAAALHQLLKKANLTD